MKTMTCKQLGGACDMAFHAITFERMAGLSQEHGRAMFEQNDIPHLEAMQNMAERTQDSISMKQWMNGKICYCRSLEMCHSAYR